MRFDSRGGTDFEGLGVSGTKQPLQPACGQGPDAVRLGWRRTTHAHYVDNQGKMKPICSGTAHKYCSLTTLTSSVPTICAAEPSMAWGNSHATTLGHNTKILDMEGPEDGVCQVDHRE